MVKTSTNFCIQVNFTYSNLLVVEIKKQRTTLKAKNRQYLMDNSRRVISRLPQGLAPMFHLLKVYTITRIILRIYKWKQF